MSECPYHPPARQLVATTRGPLTLWYPLIAVVPVGITRRSKQQGTTGEGANKSDETIVTFSLESKSVQQIDGFISAAYDSYRAMIKGERQASGEEQRYVQGCHGVATSLSDRRLANT